MRSLGFRFVASAFLGIAVLAALSSLGSDDPDGFESSASSAGFEADEPDEERELSIPPTLVVVGSIVLVGVLATAATRMSQPDVDEA